MKPIQQYYTNHRQATDTTHDTAHYTECP